MARADVYRRLGEHRKALVDLEAAIAKKPKLGEAYASRALVYTLQGKEAEAKEDIAKAEEFKVKKYARATDLSVLAADFEALKAK